MPQIPVMYVGPKARKEDNVAASGAAWNGAGDVQHVSPDAWAKLSAFPDVWRHAKEGAEVLEQLAAAAPQALSTAEPAQLGLEELQAMAQAIGYRLVPIEAAAPATTAPAEQPAQDLPPADKSVLEHKYVLVLGDEASPTYIVLDTMNIAALKAFATEHGLQFNRNLKDAEKARAELFAAATATKEA